MPTFFGQFSRKPGKRSWRYMALCGIIFVYLEKRLKNVKNERKQYICQLFLANFEGNVENVRGAMWRYFFVPRKTAKKRQK